jgi:hypothetical protein
MTLRNLAERDNTAKILASLEAGTLLGRAIEANNQLKTQGVFYGLLSSYQAAKTGSADPSQVAFQVWFLPKGENKPAWTASYDIQQRPLSENIFHVSQAMQEGIRYRSAAELLNGGLVQVAREFERYRSQPK